MPIQRIPLADNIGSRDGTLDKDARTTNVVFEKSGQHHTIIKRPGLTYVTQITPVTPPQLALSQGMTNFKENAICVVDNVVYKFDTGFLSVSTIGATSSTLNRSYFAKMILDSKLFFHNTINGYTWDSTTFSTVTLPEAGPFVPGTVFLDNWIFIGSSSSNKIYSSYIGDPSQWDANSNLVFEQTSDTLIGIAKHLNYLVAFGKSSTQFYYDSGVGTDTYSPLLPAQSYTMEIGCASGDSVVATDNTVLWISYTKTHGRSVHLLDGVSPVKISTNSIDKIIEKDNLSKVSAFVYKFYGHTLYLLTLHNTGITIVFDVEEKVWYQWTQWAMASSDQPNAGTYFESYFRPTFYAQAANSGWVLDDDTAALYYFNSNIYQDNGQPIYCRMITPIIDNGSTSRKFYGRLEVVGDKVDAIMRVRHSGDDYITWSSYRSVNLNSSRPQVYLGGADRRRAWEFLHTDNTPLRLESAEIEFRIGEMDQEQNQGRRG